MPTIFLGHERRTSTAGEEAVDGDVVAEGAEVAAAAETEEDEAGGACVSPPT